MVINKSNGLLILSLYCGIHIWKSSKLTTDSILSFHFWRAQGTICGAMDQTWVIHVKVKVSTSELSFCSYKSYFFYSFNTLFWISSFFINLFPVLRCIDMNTFHRGDLTIIFKTFMFLLFYLNIFIIYKFYSFLNATKLSFVLFFIGGLIYVTSTIVDFVALRTESYREEII